MAVAVCENCKRVKSRIEVTLFETLFEINVNLGTCIIHPINYEKLLWPSWDPAITSPIFVRPA